MTDLHILGYEESENHRRRDLHLHFNLLAGLLIYLDGIPRTNDNIETGLTLKHQKIMLAVFLQNFKILEIVWIF